MKIKFNQKAIDEITKTIETRLLAVGELVTNEARNYASGKNGGPNVDTGRLRASINYQAEKDMVKIGTNVEYAPYLEYGTSRMTPKPFLRPALDSKREQIKRILGAKI